MGPIQGKRAVILATTILWAAPVLAATPRKTGAEVALPQATHRLTNWAADGNKGLWIEAIGGQWYYAEFLGSCPGVGGSDALAFQFSPGGSLDRFSRVIVSRPLRRSCPFKSFSASNGPPHGRSIHSQSPPSEPQK